MLLFLDGVFRSLFLLLLFLFLGWLWEISLLILLPTKLELTVPIVHSEADAAADGAVGLFLDTHALLYVSVGDETVTILALRVSPHASVLLHVVSASADILVHEIFEMFPFSHVVRFVKFTSFHAVLEQGELVALPQLR